MENKEQHQRLNENNLFDNGEHNLSQLMKLKVHPIINFEGVSKNPEN